MDIGTGRLGIFTAHGFHFGKIAYIFGRYTKYSSQSARLDVICWNAALAACQRATWRTHLLCGIINGGHGLMGGTLWEPSKLIIFKKKIEIDHLGNSVFLKFSMINLNLKYNNDDKKHIKNVNNNWK